MSGEMKIMIFHLPDFIQMRKFKIRNQKFTNIQSTHQKDFSESPANSRLFSFSNKRSCILPVVIFDLLMIETTAAAMAIAIKIAASAEKNIHSLEHSQ